MSNMFNKNTTRQLKFLHLNCCINKCKDNPVIGIYDGRGGMNYYCNEHLNQEYEFNTVVNGYTKRRTIVDEVVLIGKCPRNKDGIIVCCSDCKDHYKMYYSKCKVNEPTQIGNRIVPDVTGATKGDMQ